MTKEQAINVMRKYMDTDSGISEVVAEAHRMAIAALSAEPCEDAISRQAVIYGLAVIAKAKARSDAQKSLMGRSMFFVEHMPPVQPIRPRGHWIDPQQDDGMSDPIKYQVRCSNCGWDIDPQTWYEEIAHNYCPNCGADMRESEDAE